MASRIAVDVRLFLAHSSLTPAYRVPPMHLDLTDEEASALRNLLTQTIENDRYPLSPRIQTLRGILAKFGPIAPAPPPPARPRTPEEREPSQRPRGQSRPR